MRSAQLPSFLAIRGDSHRHWVVSATDGSESWRLFCSSLTDAEGSTSFAPLARVPRFRLDHLIPKDWGLLLHHCRNITMSNGSFTYSSPGGDICAPVEEEILKAFPQHPILPINAAFMHIVERFELDFVPNNIIYYELRRRYSVGPSDTAATPWKTGDFSDWLRHLQERAEEGEDRTVFSEHGVSDILEDPLAHDALAVEKTLINQRLCSTGSSYTPGDVTHDSAEECVFTFFPHHVVMSDCIPYRSRHFVVMVNHKPIAPGHLMVVPIRCIGTISALTDDEVKDWGHVMYLTLQVLKRIATNEVSVASSCSSATASPMPTGEGGFSIAIQQGVLAGQTVPHLHTHVIPFNPLGKLAGEPEHDEVEQQRQPLRTGMQMREETEMLRSFFNALSGNRED